MVLLLAAACGGDATGPGDVILTLHVAPQTAACVGVGPQQCLQVRERADRSWQLHYGGITGFTFEPGYHYTLRVVRIPVAEPPADGSSIELRLLGVVEKVPA